MDDSVSSREVSLPRHMHARLRRRYRDWASQDEGEGRHADALRQREGVLWSVVTRCVSERNAHLLRLASRELDAVSRALELLGRIPHGGAEYRQAVARRIEAEFPGTAAAGLLVC